LVPSDLHGGPPPITGSTIPAVAIDPPTIQPSAPLPSVFNDTLIHRGGAAQPSARSQIIELTAAAGARPMPLASATAAQWVGELGGAMANWMAAATTGDGSPIIFGSPAEESDGLPATIEKSSIKILEAAAGSSIVSMPARALYRFAGFDPVATFADAMADFTRESLGTTPVATVEQRQVPSRRAWYITGAVLVVDGLLVARWLSERAAARKKDKKSVRTNPESPQAGILPTGL
jgi:hypothetical protein